MRAQPMMLSDKALAWHDRCETLCYNINKAKPTCECGEREQFWLVNYFVQPALWKCRTCGKKFETDFE